MPSFGPQTCSDLDHKLNATEQSSKLLGEQGPFDELGTEIPTLRETEAQKGRKNLSEEETVAGQEGGSAYRAG